MATMNCIEPWKCNGTRKINDSHCLEVRADRRERRGRRFRIGERRMTSEFEGRRERRGHIAKIIMDCMVMAHAY